MGVMRVALIGLGAIGRQLFSLTCGDPELCVVGALVANRAKPRAADSPLVCATLDELLALGPDVVVEVAGHDALKAHGSSVLRAGTDLLLVSVGALAEPEVERGIRAAATAGRSRAIVASGAIGALDALAAASVGGLTRVTHTTRKPPHSLLNADEAAQVRQPKELFRGSARAAVLRFPESINVAAAVSLAGIGLDRTEVCVMADPGVERNQHEVFAQGAFGELRFEIKNVPSADNPKTGRLVAMSIVHALRRGQASLVIG
jgi:aspartate dehydrogenase